MLYTRVLREFRKRENGLGEGRKCFVEEVEPEQLLVGGKQPSRLETVLSCGPSA